MLEGSILQKLEAAHRGSKRPLNFGVYYKNTLVALCHALEDFILESGGTPLMITAFQRGKWYLKEAERYGDLADKASHVVIMATADAGFAEHPTSQRSNVALVNLTPDDPVAQEWHLMILSETYSAMVLCQELSSTDYGPTGVPENDLERKFYGFWTFEAELVQETMELAIAHIGHYAPDLQQALKRQIQTITAAYGTKPRDDIGIVVTRVVDYLQHSQEDVSHIGESELFAAPIHEQELDENLVSSEMQAFLRMAQLIDQANAANPLAAAEIAAMAEAMGQLLDLPSWQLKRLRLAGLLHGLGSSLMTAVHSQEEAPSCSLTSAVQALRVMPRMRAIAQIITHQTEWWDGTGTPAGLAYDAIPLESRILGLVAHFQWHVRQLRMSSEGEQTTPNLEEILSKALMECQRRAGEAFDPKLVEALALLVMGMQQGMSLQVNQPKIAAGMWLLDSHPNEELIASKLKVED
ncbi:DICT sensory domain-containing protein [Allocoleopsis sp.]|uniref:DICT sensory domain-containing protein n=1 Tax=Allocoleopsis sp. TaxID=3088169 RepID=UPI002FD730C1